MLFHSADVAILPIPEVHAAYIFRAKTCKQGKGEAEGGDWCFVTVSRDRGSRTLCRRSLYGQTWGCKPDPSATVVLKW